MGIVELSNAAPRFKSSFLYSIFGIVWIAQDGQRRSVTRLEMRTHESIEVRFGGRRPERHHLLHNTLVI